MRASENLMRAAADPSIMARYHSGALDLIITMQLEKKLVKKIINKKLLKIVGIHWVG